MKTNKEKTIYYFKKDPGYDTLKRITQGWFTILKTNDNRSIYLNEYTTIGVHVRRGDYLKLSEYHPVQPIEYYKKGINHIIERLSVLPKIVVVSDDREWCKEHFDSLDPVYSCGNTEEDFSNLFFCDHFVCANSTFSWWAAYLRWYYKRDAMVVVPDNWSHEFDNKWRFPGEWVIL